MLPYGFRMTQVLLAGFFETLYSQGRECLGPQCFETF